MFQGINLLKLFYMSDLPWLLASELGIVLDLHNDIIVYLYLTCIYTLIYSQLPNTVIPHHPLYWGTSMLVKSCKMFQ